MSWLLWSIIIGVVLFLIGFLCVFSANKKYKIIRQQFKNIDNENSVTVCGLLDYEYDKLQIEGLQYAESDDFAYEPKTKTVYIESGTMYSKTVFDVTAVSHELGHALEHKKGNRAMAMWYVLINLERFTSRIVLPFFIIGVILSLIPGITSYIGTILINLSTLSVVLMLLGRLINLPNEKTASDYAIKILTESGAFNNKEIKNAKKILRTALSTYVLEFYLLIFSNFILLKRLFGKYLTKIKTKANERKEKQAVTFKEEMTTQEQQSLQEYKKPENIEGDK